MTTALTATPGATATRAVVPTGDPRIDALLMSEALARGSTLRYHFSTAAELAAATDIPASDGRLWTLDAAQAAVFAAQTRAFADVAAIGFAEDTALGTGAMRVFGHDDGNSYTRTTGGAPDYIAFLPDRGPQVSGGFEPPTILHELGHALGLKHPFEGSPQLSGPENGFRYTLMAYDQWTDQEHRLVAPATLQLYDVLAVQHLYGRNDAFRAGDDVYRWDDGALVFRCLWDAGGEDTLDASNQSRGVILDLMPGHFSSIGRTLFNERFVEAAGGTETRTVTREVDGVATTTMLQGNMVREPHRDNLAIAFGSVIERAIGSGQADTLLGNDADNVLVGNAGDDYLDGAGGHDVLTGGPGADTFVAGDGDTITDYGPGDLLFAPAGATVNFVRAGGDTLARIGTSTVRLAEVTDPAGIALTRDATPPARSPLDGLVNHPPAGGVSIQGMAALGWTLGSSYTFTDQDGNGTGGVAFRWLRDGVDTGVSSPSYPVSRADLNHAISLQVRYVDGLGNEETLTSAATAPVREVGGEGAGNRGPAGGVSLSGTPAVGSVLAAADTLNDPDGIPAGAVGYHWLRDGIEVATGPTYVPTRADVGQVFQVEARYIDAAGFAERRYSPATAAIDNVNGVPELVTPLADQIAREDTEFRYTLPGAAFSDPDIGDERVYAVVRADGSALPAWLSYDPASRTLQGTPAQQDVGSVDLRVSASDRSGAQAVDTFILSVANVNDLPAGALGISGTPVSGQILQVAGTLTDADGIPAGAIAYRWLRGGLDTGVVGVSYRLSQADVGGTLAVLATYTDAFGTVESVISPATVPVAAVPPAVPPGAAGNGAPLTRDPAPVTVSATHVFGVADFPFSDPDTGDGLQRLRVESLPDDGQLRLAGVPVRPGDVISVADVGQGRFSYAAPGAATGSWTTHFAYRVSDGKDFSATTGHFGLKLTPPPGARQGSDGSDALRGSARADFLIGNDGDDRLDGKGGNDRLFGESGDDTLKGGAGGDYLAGGSGNDRLLGQDGRDILIGGAGNDLLDGGAGSDSYRYLASVLGQGDLTGGDRDLIKATRGDRIGFDPGLWDQLGITGRTLVPSIDAAHPIAFTGRSIQIDADANGSYDPAHDVTIDIIGQAHKVGVDGVGHFLVLT